MKKSIITALSILLTILILVQTMSIAVFAIDATSKIVTDETIELSETTNNNADMPNIVCEIEEKRTAFSMDYLLEDGSFCSVISDNPIHKNVNGKWINKNETQESFMTINEVLSNIQTLDVSECASKQENRYSGITTDSSNGIVINWGRINIIKYL